MDNRNEGLTIDLPDDRYDSGGQVDAETTVSAAAVAFNNAALPPDMPVWLKAAIRAEASTIIENLRDDEIRLTDAKEQEEDQDDRDNLWQAMVARERQWDQSRVEIGGVTLSGQEWDDAYESLSDPEMRSQLIDRMVRKKGWSKDRAEKAAKDALTLAQIAQRRKDGTMTADDEAKADEIKSRNPDAAEMVREAARMKNSRGFDASYSDTAIKQSTFADRERSVETGANEIAAAPTDATFKGAPDLISRFDAARIASIVRRPEAPTPATPSVSPTLDLNATF